MKIKYRGYEIDVHRDKCLGGWSQLYFSIFELNDEGEPWIERLTNFTTGDDTVREYIGYMKERIDAELEETHPWGERGHD